MLGLEDSFSLESQNSPNLVYNLRPPMLRKSKLLVVDLAGSERIQKSGLCLNLLLLEEYFSSCYLTRINLVCINPCTLMSLTRSTVSHAWKAIILTK